MMPPEQIRKALYDRFTWVSDGRLDSWHILPASGPVEGDCDDYAVTVLADLTERNLLRFVLWLITFKAVFWMVRDPQGEAHAALWVRGIGWTDNQKSEWTAIAAPHKKRYPMLFRVPLKLIIGLWDRT